MKSQYHKHYFDDPKGHIFMEKKGAVCIELHGAASMPQEELDFFGELFAAAIRDMTPEQEAKVKSFKTKVNKRR